MTNVVHAFGDYAPAAEAESTEKRLFAAGLAQALINADTVDEEVSDSALGMLEDLAVDLAIIDFS